MILMHAFALHLEDENNSEIQQCSSDEPVRWITGSIPDVQNPEDEIECNSDDEQNNFKHCGCVPARMVKWDTDTNRKTDMSLLGVSQVANKKYQNGKFHQMFNTREYQALNHSQKMEMMWDQLTKIRKVKCQDIKRLWRNFQQNPNLSFKRLFKSEKRLSESYINDRMPLE